jgi:hypothetical protein
MVTIPNIHDFSFLINLYWRSRRDSNPRYAFDVYTLSRRAPSTTRPLLRAPVCATASLLERENGSTFRGKCGPLAVNVPLRKALDSG